MSTAIQDQDRAVENTREYQTKVDLRLARIQRVDNKIHAQEW